MTNAAFSLQDCDRKGPAKTFPVTFIEDKPAGIELRITKSVDPRTRRAISYTVKLAPAAGTGTWQGPEDHGAIEHVARHEQTNSARVEGMWIEAGERLLMAVELSRS